MNDMNHEKYMREALAEAKSARSRGDRPIGCVIVHGDNIVARGSNHEFTRSSKFEHAEMVTMRSCAEFLFQHSNECTLYTTVEPCVMCLGMIVMANIRQVVFGAEDPDRGGTEMIERVGYVRRSIHRGYIGGILAEESKLMQSEFTEPNNKQTANQ